MDGTNMTDEQPDGFVKEQIPEPMQTALTTLTTEATAGPESESRKRPREEEAPGSDESKQGASNGAGSSDESTPKKRRVEDVVLPPGRSIFIGAVHPQQVTLYDICKMATYFGGLESVKMVPEKHCAFVNYATEFGAKGLIARHQQEPFHLGSRELKIRWARTGLIARSLHEAYTTTTERLPTDVEQCIKTGGSRRLLVEWVMVSEELLFHTFLQHGEIENWWYQPQTRLVFA